jgi:hypothetical protein
VEYVTLKRLAQEHPDDPRMGLLRDRPRGAGFEQLGQPRLVKLRAQDDDANRLVFAAELPDQLDRLIAAIHVV